MKAWTCLAVVGTLVLTGCTGSNPSRPNTPNETIARGATVKLSIGSVDRLRSAAYRVQDQTIADFTPTSYLKAIKRIQLLGGEYSVANGQQGSPVTIYSSDDMLELAGNAASVSAIVNQEASAIATGSYSAIAIELGNRSTVKGQVTLGGQTYYTRAATESDTTQGPAEAFAASTQEGSLPPQILKFPQPLELKEGDNVTISLLYDLTGSWKFGTLETGWKQYANGSNVSWKYFPMFAFIGTPPKPEVYEITVADPQHLVQPSDKWHYRMVMFASSTGEILGLQALGLIDPGYDYPSFETGNFVDTWKAPVRNADGSYQLFGLNDMDPTKIPQWEVPAFRRMSHEGEAKFFMYGRTMPVADTQATLSYRCVKVE